MAMHCMKLFEMSGLSKLNPQPLPLSIVLCLLCVPLTLSILSFMLYFLPIPCLHNVVLCLLCVPLATSVYSILSFMLYFCHSFAHIVYIALLCFTLCTHSCITRAYQYQSINQSISTVCGAAWWNERTGQLLFFIQQSRSPRCLVSVAFASLRSPADLRGALDRG